jgi:hypothetical protein
MATALIYLEFLQRQKNFQRDALMTNLLICDNQGLLTRIEEAVQWNYTTPNVTLPAEWDIEAVILATYKTLAVHFSFLHMKSHQDDDVAVNDLFPKT